MDMDSPCVRLACLLWTDRQITMGWESKPMVGGKRRRPAVDDEVYLDNFHTHKRYLSEVRACVRALLAIMSVSFPVCLLICC